MSYETTIRNKRDKTVNVLEVDGLLVSVPAGESVTLESVSPATVLARWKEIIFHGKDEVKLIQRDDWTRPDGFCEVLNAEGQEVEYRMLGGRQVALMRSVPVLLSWSDFQELTGRASMTIKNVLTKARSSQYPGYVAQKWVLEDQYSERQDAAPAPPPEGPTA